MLTRLLTETVEGGEVVETVASNWDKFVEGCSELLPVILVVGIGLFVLGIIYKRFIKPNLK